jgi:PhnB protein
MQLSNYLFFTTNCEDALGFYSQCGLGNIVELKRYTADNITDVNSSMEGLVMHARFEGEGVHFFASDNHDAEPMRGSAHILVMETKGQTEQLFRKMSEGGNITTPLCIQPWGSFYGKMTDRFGVQWMFDCPL